MAPPMSTFATKIREFRVFHRRLTSGGIFNNRYRFNNNMLLFPIVFWKFLWL